MKELTLRNGTYYLGSKPLTRGADAGGFMVFYQPSDYVDVKKHEDTVSIGYLHFVEEESMDIKFSVQYVAEYTPEINMVYADARAFNNG